MALSRFMNNRAKKNRAYQPTYHEQLANCCTHGVFIFPAIAGLSLLLFLSNTFMKYLVAWLYGVFMVALFSISATFHALCLQNKFGSLRKFFHLGDRVIIYLFIAASYMPWLLLQNVGFLGEFVAVVLWLSAIVGCLYTFIFYEKYKTLETILYLALGICPSFSLFFVNEAKALLELALGGACYVGGVALFKADGRIPFAHALWHLFVASGAALHFYAVFTHLYNT